MNEIKIEHQPSPQRLQELGVSGWPIWEKEPSEFPWHYDERERCYLLAGDVTVTPEGGKPVQFGQGDFVTFPAGMSCTWLVRKAVRKHYLFG